MLESFSFSLCEFLHCLGILAGANVDIVCKLRWRTIKFGGKLFSVSNGCVWLQYLLRQLNIRPSQATSRIVWLDVFLNGIVCFLCQAFFIRRCWKVMW
jgi:hypothetical protein